MSHDRKPGRVRVVEAGNGSSRRRRGDGAARGGKAANSGTSGRRGQAMLIVLFLVASIGAAIAVALQLPT